MFDPNPVKSDVNLQKHGVAFNDAERFEWDVAIEARDTRFPYAEVRTVAVGPIGDDIFVLAFTRRGSLIRIISLRLANKKELARYVGFRIAVA